MKKLLPPFVHSYPAPAVLVGCGSMQKPNLITCSWFGTVCSEPPMVSLAVRGSRYSCRLIHESRAFSVNIPHAANVKDVIHCGTVSGSSHDKFRDLGLTPALCMPLENTPMIAEYRLSLACRVHHELALGSHDVFIAEVIGVHGEELADQRPRLFADEQVVYLDGKYWQLQPVTAPHES